MKKVVVILLTILMLFSLFQGALRRNTVEASEDSGYSETIVKIVLRIGQTKFTVNGNTRTLDLPPLIKHNRTLLPIRPIIEALGGTVKWDPAESKVTITLGSALIELWIGKSTAKVNGVDMPIDSTNPEVVPEIINNRTMLPLRFIAESLGCDVQWDGTTKTITITYQANLISIKVGGIYTIDLEENSTTGYKWHCNITNPSIVGIESEKFIPPSGNRIGAPGEHVWIIKGLKPGTTEIVFKYYRDWEPDKIKKMIVYKVFVN